MFCVHRVECLRFCEEKMRSLNSKFAEKTSEIDII